MDDIYLIILQHINTDMLFKIRSVSLIFNKYFFTRAKYIKSSFVTVAGTIDQLSYEISLYYKRPMFVYNSRRIGTIKSNNIEILRLFPYFQSQTIVFCTEKIPIRVQAQIINKICSYRYDKKDYGASYSVK